MTTSRSDDDGVMAKEAGKPGLPDGAKPDQPLSASRFGVRGDGKADDTASIQKALDSGRSIRLPKGRFAISNTLHFKADGQQLIGAGHEATTIVARGDFSVCLRADDLGGVAVQDLSIDANRTGRRGILKTRTLGLFLVNCRDARVESCRVLGTIGGPRTPDGPPTSGVGIAVGYGRRCVVAGCTVEECGTKAEGEASDGIYTSGEFNVVRDCIARNCTDTAFVIEDSDYSGVVRCRAEGCSAGLGITVARDAPARGNYADLLTIHDWDSAVTGGIQIGCPLSTTRGDLRNTSLVDVEIERVAGSGPAINVRRTGAACTIGLLLRNVRVKGAGVQGMVIDAESVGVFDCKVDDTEWTAIQVQPRSRDIEIRGCKITNPKGFGISILAPVTDVLVLDNEIRDDKKRMTWGLYTFDSAEGIFARGNTIKGARLGMVGGGKLDAKAEGAPSDASRSPVHPPPASAVKRPARRSR
jgi:hypothetical protein